MPKKAKGPDTITITTLTHLDGTGLRFETLEHSSEYPDTMPQAIRLTDAEGRSCVYVPITESCEVVDSKGYVLDGDD